MICTVGGRVFMVVVGSGEKGREHEKEEEINEECRKAGIDGPQLLLHSSFQLSPLFRVFVIAYSKAPR
jgi:hypothetical protein